MKYVRLIDDNGLFIEDTFVDILTEFTVETLCEGGFYKPKWNGTKWIEGLTQTEIDAIKNVELIKEPLLENRIKNLELAILEVL